MFPRVAQLIAVVAVGLTAPVTARATCARDMVRQAVVARITQESIDAILKPLGSSVPQQVELDDLETTVFECGGWFDSTVIRTTRGSVNLQLSQLQVDLDGGDIVIDIAGDIAASAALDLQVCALPDGTCEASAAAHGVAVHARVSLDVDACVPSITMPEFSITFANDDISVDLTDCGAYSVVFELLEDWLRNDLLDYAKQELETFIPELISTQLSALTTDLLGSNLTVQNVSFRVQPEWVIVDDDSLSLSFAALSTADKIADCARGVAIEPNAIDPTEGIRLPDTTSVAVSGRLAQNIAVSAWQAGWACLELSSIAPDVTTALDAILPGAKTEVSLAVTKPPRVTLLPSEDGAATLELEGVEGGIRINVPGDRDYRADFATGLAIGADIGITELTRQVALSPREVRIAGIEVTMGSADIGFSEESIDRFVRNEVAPLFTSTLQELPLVSSLFEATLVAVSIENIETTQNAVIAELGMAGIFANDDVAPTTKIDHDPQCPCAATMSMTMKSTDDTTPDEMMRHRVEVDGERDPILRSGSVVVVRGLTAGTHTIRVAAVDLAGNVDPKAPAKDVVIDATPPTVKFVDPHIGIIPTDGTRLVIDAEDDIAMADTIDYTVAIVSRTAIPDNVIVSRTIERGEPIDLYGLPDGVTIRVRVTAHDRAGNVGTTSLSFAVLNEPTMGCSSVSADSMAVFAALSVLLMRRRKRSC